MAGAVDDSTINIVVVIIIIIIKHKFASKTPSSVVVVFSILANAASSLEIGRKRSRDKTRLVFEVEAITGADTIQLANLKQRTTHWIVFSSQVHWFEV